MEDESAPLSAISRFVRASSDPPTGKNTPNGLGRIGENNFEFEVNPFDSSFFQSSDSPQLSRDPSRTGVGLGTSDTSSSPGSRLRPRAKSNSPPPRSPAILGRNNDPRLNVTLTSAAPNFGQLGWPLDRTPSFSSLMPPTSSDPTSAPDTSAFSAAGSGSLPTSFESGLPTLGTDQVPTSSIGGPATPSTAALFAMLTNGTPGINQTDNTTARNQFDNSFKKANALLQTQSMPSSAAPISQGKPESTGTQEASSPATTIAAAAKSSAPLPSLSSVATTTADNVLSTGVSSAQIPPLSLPGLSASAGEANFPNGSVSLPQASGDNTANPLYLLTQAHQLSQHSQDDTAVMAAATLQNLTSHSNVASPSAASPSDSLAKASSPRNTRIRASDNKRRRTSTIKSDPDAADQGASATRSDEKAKTTPRRGTRKKSRKSYAEDEENTDLNVALSDNKEKQPSSSHKNSEPEDEKRKSFLERNRQAALKCRERKKQWLTSLQQRVEFLQNDNDNLTNTVNKLREEIASLRGTLGAHKDGHVPVPEGSQRVNNNGELPTSFGFMGHSGVTGEHHPAQAQPQYQRGY